MANAPVKKYILDPTGERPIVCNDPIRWANWMQYSKSRIVIQEHICNGTILVSTVFLGVEIGPRMWETMAFHVNGQEIDWCEFVCERCSGTREQALAQHKSILDLLTNHAPDAT
jgi:hypothetical protein